MWQTTESDVRKHNQKVIDKQGCTRVKLKTKESPTQLSVRKEKSEKPRIKIFSKMGSKFFLKEFTY